MKTVAKFHALLLFTSFAGACEPESHEGGDGNDSGWPGEDDGGSDSGTPSEDDGSDDSGLPGEDDGGAPVDPEMAHFFLPTSEPDNTSAPTLEVDAAGGIHAVYPAYAGGNAYYAYCPAGCEGSEDVSVVALPTDGTVSNAMLALDATGRPSVLLSTFQYVYYASCVGDCNVASSWTTTKILDHAGDREVTGEAFALDPQGRPRFVMHTYVAYLGIGQKAPETHYVTCDVANCHDPASWSSFPIAGQIWQSSHLRFDAQGKIHLATVARVEQEGQASVDSAAYVSCAGDCAVDTNWVGHGLVPAFSSLTDVVTIKPAVSLALTRAGAPRVLALGINEAGMRDVVYLACNGDCTNPQAWAGTILSESDDIGAGLDLALDAQDRPRFVYTFDYNIGMAACDVEPCEASDAPWSLTKVELGSEMSPDEIFLWPNCNVGAWFLHSPSIALAPNGEARVGYQARDISGGWSNPDPYEPDCVAGTDMTWSRMAIVPPVGG